MSERVARGVRISAATVLMVAFILPSLSSSSSAHLPVFDTGGGSYDDAERIDNLRTSYAFYGELERMTPGSSDGAKYYVFEGTGGQELKFEIGKRDFFFSPCVLLVGPGLQTPDEETQNIIDSSDINLPDGMGALGWSTVFLPWVGYYADAEFEPFTQTTFYYAYGESVVLPSDGTYYLILTGVVYSEELGEYQISSGKYFLVTGYLEEFTVVDFALMPWFWSKVQSFWSQQGEVLFLLPTFAVFAALLALEMFMRRADAMFRSRRVPAKALYFGSVSGSFLMVGSAVNQLSLITLYSSEHGWEGIVLLVLALQMAGLALGIGSFYFIKVRFFQARSVTVAVAAVIMVAALLLGAGLILGPFLFFVPLVTVALAGPST